MHFGMIQVSFTQKNLEEKKFSQKGIFFVIGGKTTIASGSEESDGFLWDAEWQNRLAFLMNHLLLLSKQNNKLVLMKILHMQRDVC